MERLLPVFERTGVETRYFAQPLDWYADGPTFESRNLAFAECGVDLTTRAARTCLDRAGVQPADVDHVFCVTTTGLMTPSLDARLVATLGLREDVRRLPLFGLGCAGGAGALVRAADILRGSPSQRALVVSLELCSLVFSPVARTATDLVGTALFGDGAAAALLEGDEVGHVGPEIGLTRTHLFLGAPDLMGWNFTSDGMRLILSREVPEFVASDVQPVVERFMHDGDVRLADVESLHASSRWSQGDVEPIGRRSISTRSSSYTRARRCAGTATNPAPRCSSCCTTSWHRGVPPLGTRG